MKRTPFLKLMTAICCGIMVSDCIAQSDTATGKASSVFASITGEIKQYKVDTTTPPDDKTTRVIVELRNLRGGFNINEAIAFKLEEDRQKNETPVAKLDSLQEFFTAGNGKKWLDNATIWIYRSNFTYPELKQLVKFYKTSAGKKMAERFPVVMLETLAAAQYLQQYFMELLKPK